MYYVKDIHKTFDGNHVLKGVSLDIAEHKTTVLVGPSGSGKTTLLRCINLLEMPDSGTVHLNGAEMTFGDGAPPKYAGSAARALRKKTGMVFQNFQLFPHKTVLGNIIEGPIAVLGMEKAQAVSEAEALLKKVGLSEKRDAWPRDLSGGQQQRVAIARAIVKRPKIIFADEPTAALDYQTSIEVLSVFEEVKRQLGATVMMITHNPEIAKMADRVIKLRDGKVSSIKVNLHPLSASELVW